MVRKTVRVRLDSEYTYAEFLQELNKMELSSDKLLSVSDVIRLSEMRTSCLDHMVHWIINTGLLVCRECSKIFANRTEQIQFV